MGIQSIIPKQKLQDTVIFNHSLFSNEDKFILAPMQNLTNLFFRKTFSHFLPMNIDYAVSPFISANESSVNTTSILFKDILVLENENIMPVIPQILGNSPEYILQCAKNIERLGYREINLNMGCPKKDIVSRYRGAGLMKNKELVQRIIDTILNKTTLQLSLKVRLGIKDSTELENLVPILNMYPLISITIHPRTQEQLYDGKTDIKMFKYFTTKLKHTIIYNGDIFSVNDFTLLKTQFPNIKHWMIGRGLLRNPFLCADIKNIPYNKKHILIGYVNELQKNFIDSLYHYNQINILNKMKEFTKYLAEGYHFDATPLLRESSLELFNRKLNTTLSECCYD
ncbi:MAG: tRNA-dihydrouridine synthase family protein [Bacteroidales bacterium]